MSTNNAQPAPGRRWYRMAAAVATAVILVSAGILAGALLTRDSGQTPGAAPDSPSASWSPGYPCLTETATPRFRTPPTTRCPTNRCPTVQPRRFAYQPLWPFSSLSEVAAWQSAYRSSGSQPWHLDADQSALAFTTGYLGFGEIDQVIRHTVRGDQAWVSVGFTTEAGKPFVSAIIHLVRYGAGQDAPWEVVGTKDTDLTLTTPKYGAAVSSPVRVGGRITGVDESIIVEVRQSSSELPLGTSRPVPGGGEKQPWTATVDFRGATDPALTVVARTGGHSQDVERFAITAIRPR